MMTKDRRYVMTADRRYVMTALAAAVLTVGAGSALAVDGPAQAQTGSRLCGRVWTVPDTGESLIRLIEVGKETDGVSGNCDYAQRTGGGPGEGAPYDMHSYNLTTTSIYSVTCESFKTDYLHGGPLVFEGGNWPSPQDQNDICLNMNRSDTRFEVETYWLYGDSQGQWKFRRG
jgi:hypothetical protein